jgi:hypothetical protein
LNACPAREGRRPASVDAHVGMVFLGVTDE